MSKERLEGIRKRILPSMVRLGRQSGKMQLYNDLKYIFEQAEQNIRRSKENADLNWFLQNNVESKDISKVLGRSVVESAKYVIKKQKTENKRYREAIENIEKGYKRILSEQSTRLLTEQYTRVSNLKFIRDEIKTLEEV